MSHLVAKSLNLKYLLNSDYKIDDNYVEESMDLVVERLRKANERRGLQAIDTHLKGIHQRVSHILREAGYPTELPEPMLENVPMLSFRLPKFCIQGDSKETEEQKLLKKTCEIFIDCTETRNALVRSVQEWMNWASSKLDGRKMRSIMEAMTRRETEAIRSRGEVTDALNNAKNAVTKLKTIGTAVFDEKLDDGTEKSAMQKRTLAKLNERVRRNSESIDAVPVSKRAKMMRRMLRAVEEMPADVSNLFERYDITDAEERALVEEMTTEWRIACDDIWGLLISIHEMKMLQRSTKMKIRRILYMFKLVVAALEIRDSKVRTTDEQLLDVRTEVVGLRTKMDALNSESKKFREKYSKTQSLVTRVSNERDELKYESEKLREDLGSCIDKIAEQSALIKELRSGDVNSNEEPKEESTVESDNKEQPRLTKQDGEMETLQDETRCEPSQDETIYKESQDKKSCKPFQDEMMEKAKTIKELEETIQRDKENKFLQEHRIRDVEAKLEQANVNTEELSREVTSLKEELLEKDKIAKSLMVDLKAKKEVIQKLTSLAEDSDSDNESTLVAKRNSRSKRHSSLAERRTHCRSDEEARQRKLAVSGPDSERCQSVSELARASTTKIRGRSSVRLIPPPKRSLTPFSSPSTPTIDVPSGSSVPSSMGSVVEPMQVSHLSTTVESEEYVRVRDGWEESERRCKELEVALADAEDEIVRIARKNKRRMSFQAREFHMKNILAVEEQRESLNAVYNEALNMENMVNRYKNDLAAIFDQPPLQKIAMDMKNMCYYSAADNPTDHVASLKKASDWIDLTLNKLIKYQQSVIKQLHSQHEELKAKCEQALVEETAHHVKVLAEKSKEMDRYRNQVQRAKGDANELKAENQKLCRVNEQNKEQIRSLQEEEVRLGDLFKEREKQILESEEMLTSHKKVAKYAEEMETKLRDMRADFNKLKSQLDTAQQSLARETQLRATAERAAQGRRQSLNLIKKEEKPGNTIVEDEKKPKQPSHATRRAKTLEKLLDMGPTLRLSHITADLVSEVTESLENYKKVVTERLGNVFRRYIVFRRQADIQEKIKATILASKSTNKIREKWRGAIDRIQKVYWHLQSKQEMAKKGKSEEIKDLLSEYRDDLEFVFQRVARVLIQRKFEAQGESHKMGKRDEKREKIYGGQPSRLAVSQPRNLTTHLVAPSNSVMSLESIDTEGKSLTELESLRAESQELKSDIELVDEQMSEASENKDVERVKDFPSEVAAVGTREDKENVQLDSGEDENHSSQHEAVTVVGPSSIKIFTKRTDDLTPAVSDEYKKNQQLVSAVMESTTQRNSVSSPTATDSTWDRRMSLVIPPATPAWTSAPSNNRNKQEPDEKTSIISGVPRTVQLDVNGFLHKARKQLQNSIRRHSISGPTDQRPSTSTLSDLGAVIRSRRATITGGILPGVIEGKEQTSIDQDRSMRRLESSFDRIEKESSQEKKKPSDALEIQVVRPPTSQSQTQNTDPPTKLFTRRQSIPKRGINGPKPLNAIERKPSMQEHFQNDTREREQKNIDRCHSDDPRATSSLLGDLVRRKSASDVITFPSINSTTTNK